MYQTAYPVPDRLPREVVPGLFWLGGCSNSGAWPTRRGVATTHEHLSCYLVVGSEKTLLVDTGHYAQWEQVARQLDACLDGRALDYVFPTHQEIPHAGNLGRLLDRHPEAVAVGDTREYHLYFPEIAPERLVRKHDGDSVPLGDTEFVFLDPVWYDLSGSMWGYDTARGALFSADGLGYVHDHSPEVCGLLPHEVPDEAPADGVRRFALPFVGMKYHDTRPGVARYRDLVRRHPVSMVCSSHGAPLAGAHLDRISERVLEVVEENQDSISGPSALSRDGLIPAAPADRN